jgi:hypothetical protein
MAAAAGARGYVARMRLAARRSLRAAVLTRRARICGALCAAPFAAFAGCASSSSLPIDAPAGSAPAFSAPGERAPQEQALRPRSAFGETFGVRTGAILVGDFHTQESLGVIGSSRGDRINLEDDLGLSGNGGAVRADAWYRFGRRDRLDMAWYRFDRSGTKVLQRDIHWGGDVFPVSATVTGEQTVDIAQLHYTHYFFAGDTYEFGPGLGIYEMDIRTSLHSDALGINRSFETPLPMPVLVLQGAWEFAPRWQLVGSAQLFYLELDNAGATDRFKGGVIDATLGVEHELIDHVSVGAAYDYFRVHATADRDQLGLDFDYGYSAVFVYLSVKI